MTKSIVVFVEDLPFGGQASLAILGLSFLYFCILFYIEHNEDKTWQMLIVALFALVSIALYFFTVFPPNDFQLLFGGIGVIFSGLSFMMMVKEIISKKHRREKVRIAKAYYAIATIALVIVWSMMFLVPNAFLNQICLK